MTVLNLSAEVLSTAKNSYQAGIGVFVATGRRRGGGELTAGVAKSSGKGREY
jgi:hypothetical protein